MAARPHRSNPDVFFFFKWAIVNNYYLLLLYVYICNFNSSDAIPSCPTGRRAAEQSCRRNGTVCVCPQSSSTHCSPWASSGQTSTGCLFSPWAAALWEGWDATLNCFFCSLNLPVKHRREIWRSQSHTLSVHLNIFMEGGETPLEWLDKSKNLVCFKFQFSGRGRCATH